MTKPPVANGGQGNAPPHSINIQNFNYTGSDLTEIRLISQQNPELAEKIVAARSEQIRLESFSERVGMYAATTLGIVLVAGLVAVVLTVGLWQSLIFIGMVLAGSHLIRTILTGEWSDTSWFGDLIKSVKQGGRGGSDNASDDLK